MSTTQPTPKQLRRAAERIAKRQHPDQAGSAHPNAFSKREDTFCEVRMTGGSVLIMRQDAEREALVGERAGAQDALARGQW